MASKEYYTAKNVEPDKSAAELASLLDEQLFEISVKMNTPLVSIFGAGLTDELVIARQLHCYCAVTRSKCSMRRAALSIGKDAQYGWRAMVSISDKINSQKLSKSAINVLEFYELI